MFSWFKKKKKARQQPETRAKVDGELRPEDVTVKQVSEAEAMAFDKNKDGNGGTGRCFNT